MAETTVRIAPKSRKAVQEKIDALRALLARGFASSEGLQAALPFFSNEAIKLQYLAEIMQPFDKVRARKVLNLIAAQISFLEDELEAAS